jgi:serine protease
MVSGSAKKFSLLFLVLLIANPSLADNTDEIKSNGDIHYFANQVVIKLKDYPVVRLGGETNLPESVNSFFNNLSVLKVLPLFPNKSIERTNDLGKIVVVKYNADIDPNYFSAKIRNNPEIEWAEPRFLYELDFEPNDPQYPAQQWNLLKILAAQAWDITQGDTSVVIGIVDTGVDWDHPDLAANIWINWNEIPGNGVDDDDNGFIDDIRGWDFGGLTGIPDNDPMEDRSDHGTHVAGISSAVTNNGIGIASIGFKSKIMAVKTSQDNIRNQSGQALIAYGYEGIVYAADNGAKVINCSWGGSGYSRFAQDIIDYTTSQGALVVAAAGNSGTNSSHFPSGYDKVLSVASTTQSDTKSEFSTYGPTVDVSAPGSSIYSTWQNDTYTNASGTSMASPLAAGLAALVWSVFPNYTPIQVGEQVRVTSDNIDNLNPSFAQLMGKGRINAFNAVTNMNAVSVRAVEFIFSDEAPGGNGDGIFLGGETITVGVRFVNYLNPTSNLSITLESKNNYSTVVNGLFNAGSKGTLEEFDNFSSKYTFTLNQSLPANANLNFILNFSDGSYSDYQWLNTIGNPTYATQGGNDVALTITSKGTLGYNDFPNNFQGDGFHYLEGPDLLFEGALMLATSATQVSDVARGTPQGAPQNNDFTVIQPFILNTPGTIADQQGSAIFNDDGAGGNKIGVTVKLESFSFADIPHNNYIILKYNLINNNSFTINNLYAGLYFDWDFADAYATDVTSYDTINNLSYVYNSTSGPDNWVTTAAITQSGYSFYAINNDGGDGGFGVNDANGFTDAEKWQSLSNGIGKFSAGPADISHVIGSGPFTILSGDTVDVGFVLGAGLNLDELRNIVSNARSKYPQLITSANDKFNPLPVSFNLTQNYPNPFNPQTNIEFQIADFGFVSLKVYDVLGREVATIINQEMPAGIYKVNFDASSLSSGLYLYKLQAGSFVETKKMVLLK